MKHLITISFLFILTSCKIDCIEKKTGLHRASHTLEESKKNGVFLFELKPNKFKFPLDNTNSFEIKKVWVENTWIYDCIENNAVVKKDTFMQIVIESRKRPKVNAFDYFIMEKHKGVSLGSSDLNFSYNGEKINKLQLVKTDSLDNLNKKYFEEIVLTKTVSPASPSIK